jgi:uncharacterized protein YjdB
VSVALQLSAHVAPITISRVAPALARGTVGEDAAGMKARPFGLLLLAFVSAGAGCGGGSTPTAPSAATASVFSVTVTGSGPLTSAGQSNQLTATAAFSAGTTQNVTNAATWLSSSPGVATVSSAGLVTAVATGTTTITATYQSHSGSVSALVTTDPVNSITVTGTATVAGGGQTSQLIATASLGMGATQNVASVAAWQSSNPGVVTVSSAGLVTGVAAGTTTITATYLPVCDRQ